MERRRLLLYLQIVRGLERDLYTADETISALQSMKRYPKNRAEMLVRRRAEIGLSAPVKVEKEGGLGSIIIGVVVALIIFFMWASNGDDTGVVSFGRFIGVGLGFFLVPGIGGFCGMLIGGKLSANREYQERVTAYNKALERYNQQQAQYDAEYTRAVAMANEEYQRALAEANAVNAYLDRQIALLKQARQKTNGALQNAYSLGHIYSKYRSLVPVTMFCEYLESGRCDSLDGVHGAYNLYESELRMNLIIGELRDVKQAMHTIGAKLDGIRNHQYLLYREMQENNRLISGISDNVRLMGDRVAGMQQTMGAAASASVRAANAAEVTSFHTAAIARSAQAVESMVEFDVNRRYR